MIKINKTEQIKVHIQEFTGLFSDRGEEGSRDVSTINEGMSEWYKPSQLKKKIFV